MDKDNGRMAVLTWALGIMITATAAINAWSVIQIFTLSNRVTTIEASGFTAKDGLEVWKAIADIKTDVKLLDAGKPTSKGE